MVTEEDLKHWFEIARELFKTGELATSKKLISLFVDKVIVFDEYIELKLKLKPDLILLEPQGLDKSEKYKRDTKSCPLDGAESGNKTIRTQASPLSTLTSKETNYESIKEGVAYESRVSNCLAHYIST